MSQSIALSQKQQGRFTKKVKNVKEKVNKGVIKVQEKIKTGIHRPLRGLIYIGHIPHGFYEEEMKEYFKQFGVVTNVRVCRSKKTGGSKGYGFVQFQNPEVAEIVAETMDNYLMFNRRLVCKYIPPDKQRKNIFTKVQWSTTNYPKKLTRQEHIKKRNTNPSQEKLTVTTKKAINSLKKKIDKLAALGIQHTFVPKNVPDEMKHLLKDSISQNEDVLSDAKVKNATKINTNVKLMQKSNANSGFKVSKNRMVKKSLKSIVKKKDKIKKHVIPKLSFMQTERLKRLATTEAFKEAIAVEVGNFKKLRSKTKII